MKFYTYIYGRTLKIDFREICTPPNGISEKSKSLIRQLINTDVPSNGSINRTRYLFVREANQVIFGVGVNHECFLDTTLYQTDEGKRVLRSFIGMVMDIETFNDTTSIPIDDDFFRNLYLEQIAKVWDLDDRPKNREVIISKCYGIEQSKNWTSLNGVLSFNDDGKKCLLFGADEEQEVLESLKNCQSSVVIGLNTEDHVLTAAHRFKVFMHNALCINTSNRKELILIKNEKIIEKENPRRHRSFGIKKRINDYWKTAKENIQEDAMQLNNHLVINRVDNSNTIIENTQEAEPRNPMMHEGKKHEEHHNSHREIVDRPSDEDALWDIWGEESNYVNQQPQQHPETSESENGSSDESADPQNGSKASIDNGDKTSIQENSKKKVYRLILIAIVVVLSVLFLLLTVIIQCGKNNWTTSQQSKSGEIEQLVQTMEE